MVAIFIYTIPRTEGISGQIPKICPNETKEICSLLIVILASWPILSDLGVSAGGILLPSQHVRPLQRVARLQCNLLIGIVPDDVKCPVLEVLGTVLLVLMLDGVEVKKLEEVVTGR